MTFAAVTFQDALDIAQLVAPPMLAVVAYFLRGLRDGIDAVTERVTGVESQLTTLNGRMLKMEEWRMMHERIDEERERRSSGQLEALRRDVHRAQDVLERRRQGE